tara:strand:- start:26354 stop:26554 length:201 start_codon:yes stop_codon:yes gene_type:complete
MNLNLAVAVAKQKCDKTHPATISSNKVTPNLRMILVSNGQYLTSQDLKRAKRSWTFEEFVTEFGGK